METRELIATLSRQRARAALPSPGHFAGRLLLALAAYGIVAQWAQGLRPDLLQQFTRPAFTAEILMLAALTVSAAIAAIHAMYPDLRQREWLPRIPGMVFVLLVLFLLLQAFMQEDSRMVIPPQAEAHGLRCTLCIASVAVLPAALIFGLLRKGASVHPFAAGALAVLAAAGLGCLTLRLAEANDSLLHLAFWHYLPTLAFAALGALAGRWLLKW